MGEYAQGEYERVMKQETIDEYIDILKRSQTVLGDVGAYHPTCAV